MKQAYEGYLFYQKQIEQCDKKIEKLLLKLTKDKEYNESEYKDCKVKQISHNKPNIEDLNKLLIKLKNRYASVLLGMSNYTFLKLTAELGTDLSQWKSVKNFTSWLGLAPRQNKTRKMNKRSKKNQLQE